MRKALKIYMLSLAIIFIIYSIFLARFYFYETTDYLVVLYFIFTLLFSTNFSLILDVEDSVSISITLPILLPAMVILGPFWTGLVAMIGSVELRFGQKKFIWYKFLFNRFNFFISAATAGLVFILIANIFNFYYYILSFFLASLAYFILNNGLLVLALSFSREKKGKETQSGNSANMQLIIEIFKNVLVSYFIGIIFYLIYIYIGKLFLVLSILFIYIIKDLLFSRLKQIKVFTQLVGSFLKVIDSKDDYTEGHCKRVAAYTDKLCRELKLNNRQREKIVNMAKIHDIGKINVDDKILKKKGNLTDEEYEEMKMHSRFGYNLLEEIDLMKNNLDIILYHHERYDGNGYPEGIEKDEIPLGARILSVCDAFDVMTTGRTYKPSKSKVEIIEELKDCAGSQFDPEIVEIMLKVIRKGELEICFENKYNIENGSVSKLTAVISGGN